ncbi:riboflavin biosynthesis protein PYRR, chloroplastic isoform X2 [Arachis duranensis]|uniref:Riboflavin biosynthesis protein PYRR, chloroplastic isoform X2 n=1 Tax=Arachis duranensis TaxID=130453 RepID=A0A9C6TN29_ARADU|nr:riboflavin biosynthesis protein PYRR, chloroplastic isoform X2 [Arachis duranensis]
MRLLYSASHWWCVASVVFPRRGSLRRYSRRHTSPHLALLPEVDLPKQASPHDFFWGGGRDGKGLNYLGRLLMKLRSEFLGESSSSCEQLKFLTLV